MSKNKIDIEEIPKKIFSDRNRTNILRKYEQAAITYLVQRIPKYITPNMLTFVGFLGNFTVGLSLFLAGFFSKLWLFLSAFGFIISWFGDSLDGRLAYYRDKPRKWYGFCLDLTTDWIGIIFMGIGAYYYFPVNWRIIVFLAVVLYGWEMLTAILRYKVTNKYSIDSGYFGPTEVRIILMLLFMIEYFVPNTLIAVGFFGILGILISNIIETKKLLKLADERDVQERQNKS